MPVFCAYCGKSFTRKEHLERHIPSHTNVKPHRCSGCHLSFTRRDLLQRHHATYHEARDPLDPTPPSLQGLQGLQGRTSIACQNCANAKTGCDKRVPCSRCADKNLPCAARFARRSSKAAVRAAHHANAVMNSTLLTQVQTAAMPVGIPEIGGMGGIFMNVGGLKDGLAGSSTGHGHAHRHDVELLDGDMKSGSPKLVTGSMEDFIMPSAPFVSPDTAYSDLLPWPTEYHPIDLDPIYGNCSLPLPQPDMAMSCSFDLDDISPRSSTSEPVAGASSSDASIHTRCTSIMSTADFDPSFKGISDPLVPVTSSLGEPIAEFQVVIAAESAWPFARCNPPTYLGACPRTAIVHLECLEQRCKDDASWAALEKYLEAHAQWNASDLAAVMPLSQGTRDRMLVITQGFLHKALDIHRGSVSPFGKSRGLENSGPADGTFVMLPPNNIVQYFLQSYVRSLGMYFSLVTAGCVDANEMVFAGQASTLLVLLMIAQGAAAIPMAQARFLSAGLTETCRISLFDIIEKNVELSADPIALHCALLFTMLGAWSGDKWLMDIAMGQRGMYLSMLRHAGMLERGATRFPGPGALAAINGAAATASPGSINMELEWRAWLQTETQNRLVYNWVLLDQELALLHDVNPVLAITDLNCQLPAPEPLWTATSSDQWTLTLQGLYGGTGTVPAPTTLHDLFQDFLHDNMASCKRSLTSIHLRLLLHPIQTTLSHVRQLLSCFPPSSPSSMSSSSSSSSSSSAREAATARLQESQTLLRRWYNLAIATFGPNSTDITAQASLTLYHLLCLTSVTSFPSIEHLARRDPTDPGPFWDLPTKHRTCIQDRPEALFHSGQVLRLVRGIPVDRRPAWWPAAIYRAALVLWTDATIGTLDPAACQVARQNSGVSPTAGKNEADTPSSQHGSPRPHNKVVVTPPESSNVSVAGSPGGPLAVVLDQGIPGNSVVGYLRGGEGTPVLGGTGSRRTVTWEEPGEILNYAAAVISEGRSTRFGDGIKRKMMMLRDNWALKGVAEIATVGRGAVTTMG